MFRTSSFGTGSAYAQCLKYVKTTSLGSGDPHAHSPAPLRAPSPVGVPAARGAMPPPSPRSGNHAGGLAPSWGAGAAEARAGSSPHAFNRHSTELALPTKANGLALASTSATHAHRPMHVSLSPSPQTTMPATEVARSVKAVTEEVARLRAQTDNLSRRQLDLECAAEAERADKHKRAADAHADAAAVVEFRLELRAVKVQIGAQQARIERQDEELTRTKARARDLEVELEKHKLKVQRLEEPPPPIDIFDLFGSDESDGELDSVTHEGDSAAGDEMTLAEPVPLVGHTAVIDLPRCLGTPDAERDAPLSPRAPAKGAGAAGAAGIYSPDRDFCRTDASRGYGAALAGEPVREQGTGCAQIVPALTELSLSKPDGAHSRAMRGGWSAPVVDVDGASARRGAVQTTASFGAACRRGPLFASAEPGADVGAENLFDHIMSSPAF